jgi:hypothetical protein
MNCSICQNEIQPVGDWTQGNNAEPVNDGRCCDQCNSTVVIPARLTQMRRRIPPVVAKTHTPGPWVIHAWGDADYEVLAGDSCVCNVPCGGDEGGEGRHDVTEANARLIAAAPMLLQTMAGVLKQMKDGGYFEDSVIGRWAYVIESAINRAEGRGE